MKDFRAIKVKEYLTGAGDEENVVTVDRVKQSY